MSKKTKSNKRVPATWVNLNEPERFKKIQTIMRKLGLPVKSVANSVRFAIDEWIAGYRK